MVFKPVLERQRETAFKGFVPGAIIGAEQGSADVAQCMRFSRAVTDLAGEIERALPKFEGLAIPASVNRQQGSSIVRHRQIGAGW